ncbi:hypothetical protein [Clostridium intestinale]|uniref:Uncharacterized protein n=1 Tax=Clostridium intestinale URNW TaxID=1294142 RepID=U2NGM7_9CLOT|nr:hypothetical protein [Clostridium intestinale]ERK28268.1 hypothetical protein CINTURNW_4430 [Clostridium intestinale URNW]
MQRKTLSISIGIVISLLLAINVFTYVSLTRKPKVYNITVVTEDLVLNDLTLVSFNKYLYLDKGSYLEKKEINKNVSDILIVAEIDGNSIEFPAEKEFTGERYYLNTTKFIKSNIDKDSILKVSIKYSVDGIQKEFHDNIKIINNRVKDM